MRVLRQILMTGLFVVALAGVAQAVDLWTTSASNGAAEDALDLQCRVTNAGPGSLTASAEILNSAGVVTVAFAAPIVLAQGTSAVLANTLGLPGTVCHFKVSSKLKARAQAVFTGSCQGGGTTCFVVEAR